VREFIERDLGEEGRKKSVVVVATSDQSPLVRMRGAYVATAIAEYFRDQGKDVLLMMDSLTRFAMAQREVGLSVGEPPMTRGYTPSVFALLPKLLERAGTAEGQGSITGFYTVLVEGDDFNEPLVDAARSILDGHILLSRALAAKNHYLAVYEEAEDLINIGAYVRGSSAKIDEAVRLIDAVNAYLRQAVEERVTFEDSVQQLQALFKSA
jgi:flagellum-specific ATP synthase